MEAGDVFHAPVHGEGRARQGRLEALRRLGIMARGGKVEVLPQDDLPGAFEGELPDRPLAAAQFGIEAAPVLRHRPGAAHGFELRQMPGERHDHLHQQEERQQPESGQGKAIRCCGRLSFNLQRTGHGREYRCSWRGWGKQAPDSRGCFWVQP
ncbi:MAG TPA: hypothetical protein VFV70_05760 [Hyphomonadaceae bacterium]|nr:hypothetical protein [Hyphomonadaceae bacterium]